MAEALDKLVAQAVAETSLLERALHDNAATWAMRWRGRVVPAERVVSEAGVTFYASFPALPDDGLGVIMLLCNGIEVRAREITLGGERSLDFDWTLGLQPKAHIDA